MTTTIVLLNCLYCCRESKARNVILGAHILNIRNPCLVSWLKHRKPLLISKGMPGHLMNAWHIIFRSSVISVNSSESILIPFDLIFPSEMHQCISNDRLHPHVKGPMHRSTRFIFHLMRSSLAGWTLTSLAEWTLSVDRLCVHSSMPCSPQRMAWGSLIKLCHA